MKKKKKKIGKRNSLSMNENQLVIRINHVFFYIQSIYLFYYRHICLFFNLHYIVLFHLVVYIVIMLCLISSTIHLLMSFLYVNEFIIDIERYVSMFFQYLMNSIGTTYINLIVLDTFPI